MSVYDYYLEQKEQGTIGQFKDLPNSALFDMWVVEHVSDLKISELFGVLEKSVANKRSKLGITVRDRDLFDWARTEVTPEFKTNAIYALFKLYHTSKNRSYVHLCEKILGFPYRRETLGEVEQ